MLKQHLKNWILAFCTVGIAVLSSMVVAEAGSSDISALTKKVKVQATSIAELLNVAAYVAGVGFALAGILQFKAHKENPQQTPLSKPVVMVVVAAALLFLPTVMQIAGGSLFEGGKSSLEYKAGDKG